MTSLNLADFRTGIFVGLGSNLGDREAHIRGALAELDAAADIRVVRCSSLIETLPVGGPHQPAYLNAVAEFETRLGPGELLGRLLAAERQHGRIRSVRNAPRTLDLDLLLYGQERISTPGLSLPHPRMWDRAFVLGPLAELVGPAELERLRKWNVAAPATWELPV